MKTLKSTDKLLEKILNMLEKEVPYKNDLKICGVLALTLDMQKTTVIHINRILMRPILNSDEENEQHVLIELENFDPTKTDISQQDVELPQIYNIQICQRNSDSSFQSDGISNSSEKTIVLKINESANVDENSICDQTCEKPCEKHVDKCSNENLISSEKKQNLNVQNVHFDDPKSAFPTKHSKESSDVPDETINNQNMTDKNIQLLDGDSNNPSNENTIKNTENSNLPKNFIDNFEMNKVPTHSNSFDTSNNHLSEINDDSSYSKNSNSNVLNKGEDTSKGKSLHNLFDGIISYEDNNKVSENFADCNSHMHQAEIFSNKNELVNNQNIKEAEKLGESSNNNNFDSTNNTDKIIQNNENIEKNYETSKNNDMDQILMNNTSMVGNLYNSQTHCIEIKPDNMTDQSNNNHSLVTSSYSSSTDIRSNSEYTNTNTFSTTTFNKDLALVAVSSKSNNNQSRQSNDGLNHVQSDFNRTGDYCQDSVNDYEVFKPNSHLMDGEQNNKGDYNTGEVKRRFQLQNSSNELNSVEASVGNEFTGQNESSSAFYDNDEYDNDAIDEIKSTKSNFKQDFQASINADEVIEIGSDEDSNTNEDYTYAEDQKLVKVFQRPSQPSQMQLVSYKPSPQKRFKMNPPSSSLGRFQPQKPQQSSILQQRRVGQQYVQQQNMPKQQRKCNEFDRPPNRARGTPLKRNGNPNHKFIPESFASDRNMTVLQRFSCNLCGNVYQNYISVLRHQSNVHGRPKRYNKRPNNNEYYEDGSNEDDPAAYQDEGDYQY